MAGLKLLRCVLAALACASLLGCATPPPPAVASSGTDYLAAQRSKTDAAKLAIVADGCVIRDVVGDNHVRLDASKGIPRNAVLHLRTLLAERGETLTGKSTYSVCAATASDVDDMPWATGRDKPVQAAPGPWLTARTPGQTPVAALHRAVRTAIEQASGGYKLRSLGLPASGLEQMRADLGAERLWVIQTAGIDVSNGKRVSEGLWYSLLALPVTLAEGLSGSRSQDDDGSNSIWRAGITTDVQRYTLALVDLESGDLVWWKSSNWRDAGRNFGASFGVDWALRATRPLY